MLIRLRSGNFEIRSVGPSDFVASGGFPLMFVISDRKSAGKTMAEKARDMADSSSKEEEAEKKAAEIFDAIKSVLNAGISGLNGKPFNPSDFWESPNVSQEDLFFLFDKILDLSLTKFRHPTLVPGDQLASYHLTAKTYGKTPVEIICPNGGYTDLDAYMFNMASAVAGVQLETEQAKRQMDEMKAARR